MNIQPGALHLHDVALDRGHDANIIEIGRPQRKCHAVQLVHGLREQIADSVERALSLDIVPVRLGRVAQAQGAGLVEGAGDEWGDGIVQLTRDAAPLILLQPDRPSVQLAELLGLQRALFPRLLQIVHLLAEAIRYGGEGTANGGDLATAARDRVARREVARGQRLRLGPHFAQWTRQQLGRAGPPSASVTSAAAATLIAERMTIARFGA